MSIKIPAGLTAIVHADPRAIDENAARYRSGGKRFVPPWCVYVYGPVKKLPRGFEILWENRAEPGHGAARYLATDFEATGLSPRTSFDKFPHAWAPLPLQAITAWMETSKGLVLDPIKPEEGIDNG